MKSDFMLAINQLCAERKLSRDVVLEAVEAALISAYRRNFGAATNIEVRIEPNTGDVRVYALKEVVETVQDHKAQISLKEARRVEPGAQLGDTVRIESTPRDFGRIAAQTAKQVILQRIREAERDALYSSFADTAGEIALGTIQSIDYNTNDVIVNLDGAEAILPAREQVPGEKYRRGGRLRAYVMEVRKGNRGPQITLSRRSPALLRRLLELEVPEIFNGTVEIKAIAREAGSRSKVAVHTAQEGVDPVGSCVGVRGGRIQNVVNELGGEKIDVVQWSPDPAVFIANALSPAKVMNVLLEDNPETGKTGTVIVPDRQLSLAIGKEGQNARLAAKLTGWRIDIKSASEAAEETLGRLEEASIRAEKTDLLALAEALLRKRDMQTLSEEEKALITASVEKGREEDLAWPDQAPLPEPQPEAVAGIQVEAEAGQPVPAAEKQEPMAAELPPVREESGLEAEQELPFEEELVEGSIGWVITQPEEDFLSPQFSMEEAGEWKPEWELEEFEEEELPKGGKKKKKGKRDRGQRESDFEDYMPAYNRDWRKSQRSRGW